MQENISKFENIKNIQQNMNNKEKEREKRYDEESINVSFGFSRW